MLDVLVKTGLADSKGNARRFMDASAVYINGSQLSLEKTTIDLSDVIDGFVILRRGKNVSALLEIDELNK